MCVLCAMRGAETYGGSGCIDSDLDVEGSAPGTADTGAPLPVFTMQQIANQLTTDFWTELSYSAHQWNLTNVTFDVSGLSSERAALARLAFATWADVANLTFTEVTGGANITFQDSAAGASASGSWTGGFINSMTVNVAASWFGGSSEVDGYTFQTFIHEIGHALGLGHAGNYNGAATYGVDNHYANDSWLTSVMSYFSQGEAGSGSYAYVLTPQMADILAIQTMYGSASTRTGDTVYGFNSNVTGATAYLYDFNNFAGSTVALTVYDSGGVDTLDLSGFSMAQRIDLRPGTWSDVGGLVNNVGIYSTSVIERAIGGSGNDTITGNGADNVLDGGSGIDTAVYLGNRGAYEVLTHSGSLFVLGEGIDRLLSIENLQFADIMVSSTTATVFSALDYIASYGDLISAFGTNGQFAFDHYLNNGFREGRVSDGFDGFQYLASYDDLISAYGLSESAAAGHYIAHGFGEGRARDSFDGFQYLASHDDLISAYGLNETAAAGHFVAHGFGEGRARDSFDGFQYLASHDDLINAYGFNERAAAGHFVAHGFGEGRARDTFDGFQYLASYGDLISAFGANEAAAAQHFVAHGFGEGRVRDAFDAAQYLANHADLEAAFGSDQAAATLHFIQYGYFEGRTDDVLA